ncbi:class I SAM-dependent DNA methyltransferase [Roseovarius sp. 2305UL8-3]|uniref:class I SAM-dependent DNA methyltransferase n=1 Tax=Roseovarius conchicola TaxID=3121636 RepID=UPI003529A9ED
MSTEAEQIIGLYRRHADAWVKQRGHALPERKWLQKFTDLLTPGASVLDLGCGFGSPIGRHLLDNGFHVSGVDSSPELIAIARDSLTSGNWTVGDMRQLALDEQFGGVIAWNSFFHLTPDDQRKMFRVLREHCAKEAALMFTSGPSHGEAIGTFEGEPLYHSSLDTAEYETLLDNHGFDVVEHAIEDPECGGQTVWLARRID